MRKLTLITTFFSIVFLLTASFACSSGDDNGGDEGENGEQSTATEQWAAYAFDQTVSPSSGDSGTVKSFTMEETIVEEGNTREFKIESEYLDKSTTDIKTQKMNLATSQTSTVTTSVECYQVKHHITVQQAPSGEDYPEWADVTVYIPTNEFETTTTYFWVFPMSTYTDSDENTGEWSYYLTEAMQNEVTQGTALYLPYTDGDFYEYDEYQWALFGLYGYAWMWFSPYATGGDDYLEEGSWSIGGSAYSCTSETKTIGSYTFDAWSITISWSSGGESGEYKGTFSPDLPVPIYLKVGSSSGDSQDYFEYELTDLVLE